MNFRPTFLLGLALACAPAFADDPHAIKQNDPPTGSMIRKDAATWTIPFNKRYQDLNADELKWLRGLYVNLADSDEPPYPARGMQDIVRDLIPIENAAHANGKLMATVVVNSHGDASSVKFYAIPDPKLATPIAFVLMKAKYKPARCSGKPCIMEFPLSIDMQAPLQ